MRNALFQIRPATTPKDSHRLASVASDQILPRIMRTVTSTLNECSSRCIRNIHSSLRLAVALLFIAMAALPCAAQFGANLQGTAQDSSGALLPGIKITLTNRDTKVSRQTVSNTVGEYRINSLGPGNYDVSAVAAGFTTSIVSFVLQTNAQR